MSEAEIVPGVGREGIEAALADPALTSLRLSGAPVIVVASEPSRVVFATSEAQSLFGGDLAALTRRLLHGAEPGAARLMALSHSLLPGAAPRLERLRFFFGPIAETVTVLCRRVGQPQGAPLFAVAVLGVRAPAKPETHEAHGRSNVASIGLAPHAEADTKDVGDASPAPPLDAAPKRATRFAWSTDRDHMFTSVAPALGAVVGARNADLVGRSFVDVARDLALDPDDHLVAALGARGTWSGVGVAWPIEDGALRAPVTLGAVPAFDADEVFLGFRGFGLIHPERIARVEPEAPVQHEPAADAPAATTPDTERREPPLSAVQDNLDAHGREQQDALDRSAAPHAASATPVDADATRASAAFESPASAEEGATERAADVSASEKVNDGESEEIVSVTDAGAPIYAQPGHDATTPAGPEKPDVAVGEQPEDRAAFVLDAPDEDEEAAPAAPHYGKIVPLRPQLTPRPNMSSLSPNEKSAFDEIARALSETQSAGTTPVDSGSDGKGEDADNRASAANKRARDLIDLVARFGRSEAPAQQQPSPPTLSVVSPNDAPRPPNAPHDTVDRNARAALDRLPVGVVVSRFNVPIYVNRTLLEILDYPDADAFHAAGGMDRLFHGRAPDSGAAQIESRDGELTSVDARVQAMDWDGQPATLVTLRRAIENTDAARAKSLELELRHRDAEARELHAILDTATDGVAVLDSDGRILSLNRSGEALFGYDQNEVIGEPFSVLVASESHEAAAHYLDGLKSGGVASVMNDGRELTGRARQGGSIPVFVTLGRLGTGAAPKFCAVLRDLTAWKKVERDLDDARSEAERASALKSDFLAKVSHEIRTPLNAILGFAEVIMDERFGPVGNDRYREYMRDIHKSGEHVLSIVNDLLDLSKIESGKVDLDFVSVNANAVVSECVSIMQPQANRERVVMRLSLAPNLPNIVADERSLRQIVLNLLSNAVKFNETAGQVIVSTALTDAGHAVVRIKDTGVGMSDSDLETALEPFRQVATSRKIEGTGLGLPLTKALVEANRASFTIKSRKGEGTLVEVVFPPTRVLAE